MSISIDIAGGVYSSGICLIQRYPPRVISPGHRRRADTVSTHVNLPVFGEGLPIGAVVDDVVAWEALGFVQLNRLNVRRALNGDSDQCQTVPGGDGVAASVQVGGHGVEGSEIETGQSGHRAAEVTLFVGSPCRALLGWWMREVQL